MRRLSLIIEYLKLCRFSSLGTIGIITTTGAVCTIGTIFHPTVLMLFLLGLFIGAISMVMNELCDLEIDKMVHGQHKPLVSGDISVKNGYMFLSILIAIGFLLGTYINYTNIGVLVLCFIVGTLYNLCSKKSPLATGFLSIWLFTLILYSATCISMSVPLIVWILAIYAAIDVILITCATGDLKDIQTDSINSAKVMGCRVDNGVLHLSNKYVVIFLGIHISELYLLAWSTQFFIFNIYIEVLLMILMAAYVGLHLGQTVYYNHAPYRRERMCKYATLMAFASLVLVSVFLIAIIGIEILILPLVAICWFLISNRVLFKRFSRGNW